MCVCVNELIDNLAEEEIAAAISQMRKGRAPGLDGMSTEWSQYQKKSDLGKFDNCWGMSLLDVVGKVVARILRERLQEQAEMCCLSQNVGFGRPEAVMT